MTFETDELAEAALRFSEAVRAERTSTLDALATERQAALQLLQALRKEGARRAQASTGRFLVGVLIGAAAGAAAVYFINQRSSEEARLGLTRSAEYAGASLSERLKAAIEAGRRAATTRESELWQRYRERISKARSAERNDQLPGLYEP
jgi:gas vesicle protein